MTLPGPPTVSPGAALSGRTGALRGRVSYNAVVRIAGRGIGAGLTVLALHFAISYFHSASRWGTIVAASALANLFVAFCDFGVMKVSSRDMAADQTRQRSTYGAALWAGLAASIVVMVVMVGAAFVVYRDHPRYRSLSLDLVLSLPPNALWVVSGGVLIAKARNDVRAIVDVLSSLFLLGATGATVALALSTAGYVWWTVLADAAAAALSLGLAHIYIKADLVRGLPLAKTTLRTATPIGLSTLVTSAYLQVDVIILALFASARVVGAFGVAYQFALFGISVPSIVTAALLPKFVMGDAASRRRLAQRTLDTLALVGIGSALLALVFARSALVIVAGKGFAGATPALEVFGVFVGLSFPAALFLDGLIYVGAERTVLQVVSIAAVLNLISAFVLVPFLAGIGTAAVMAGSEAALFVLAGIKFHRHAAIVLSAKRGARFLLAGGVVFGLYETLHVLTGFRSSTSWLILPEAIALVALYLACGYLSVTTPPSRSGIPRHES